MPNNFTLTRKSDLKAGPVLFAEIDDELRKHFKEPPDPDRYLGGWYNAIGQRVAYGKSFAEVREDFQRAIKESPIKGQQEYYRDLILILDYLDQHYTTHSWASIGKMNPKRVSEASSLPRRAKKSRGLQDYLTAGVVILFSSIDGYLVLLSEGPSPREAAQNFARFSMAPKGDVDDRTKAEVRALAQMHSRSGQLVSSLKVDEGQYLIMVGHG